MSALWLLLVACGSAPSSAASAGTPRTTDAAAARLHALGVVGPVCEGGSLGDEVSLVCRGTIDSRPVTLDAVTTGAPLPETPGSAGRMVEDLWVEVRVEGGRASDSLLARELLQHYAAVGERR